MADRITAVRKQLVLVAYCVAAGITATAAGAWASSGLSGTPQLAVWILVSAVLAVAAVWLSEPAVAMLERTLRGNRDD